MRKMTGGYELELMYGETRIVEKFLYFPKILDHELRWWEHAKIKQKVCKLDTGGSGEWGIYKYAWVDLAWV